jgi:hypothetical protein
VILHLHERSVPRPSYADGGRIKGSPLPRLVVEPHRQVRWLRVAVMHVAQNAYADRLWERANGGPARLQEAPLSQAPTAAETTPAIVTAICRVRGVGGSMVIMSLSLVPPRCQRFFAEFRLKSSRCCYLPKAQQGYICFEYVLLRLRSVRLVLFGCSCPLPCRGDTVACDFV